jgi:hypothetical protein
MAVADEITRIKGNIASAYSSAGAKGATLPAVQNSANLAGCIDTITGGGGGEPVNKKNLGITIDDLISDVNENGLYKDSSNTFTFDASKIQHLGVSWFKLPDGTTEYVVDALAYKFYNNKRLVGTIDLSNLARQTDSLDCCEYAFSGTSIDTAIMPREILSYNVLTFGNTFEGCLFLSTVTFGGTDYSKLSLSATFSGCKKLKTVNGLENITSLNYMSNAFSNCEELESIDLGLLESCNTISYAFKGCKKLKTANLASIKNIKTGSALFQDCVALISVDLSSLETLQSSAFTYAFQGCSKIPSLSFPSLISIQSNSFGTGSYSGYAFKNCTALTEIHFRADMQATIEAMSGYSAKWGAPSTCTIYFDL